MVDTGIGIDDFAALVADPTSDPPLDEGSLLIAAIGTGIDVETWLARLDELAGAALETPDSRTPEGLARVLFVDWAYAGNTDDYGDPRNSFLSEVIDRRLGLPITLSVLMIEIGRRIGVALDPIGMPGHFLVGASGDRFVDPFHAGAVLDRVGVARRFAEVHGGSVPLLEEYLAPTPNRMVLLRILTNLANTYVARRSADAAWVTRARLAFPELPDDARREAAEVLASVGAFRDAAGVLEDLAVGRPESADVLDRAREFRARSN
jgi:regulator of sirC expression with transglutaminase-like and TPR domain